MLSPINPSLHQSIGFLMRADMVQHEIMQVMLRQFGGELAAAQIAEIARAQMAARAQATADSLSLVTQNIQASAASQLHLLHQLNNRSLLQEAIKHFGLSEQLHNLYGFEPEAEGRSSADDQSECESGGSPEEHTAHCNPHHRDTITEDTDTNTRQNEALNSFELSAFKAIDAFLPDLHHNGYCGSLLLCVFKGSKRLPTFWKARQLAIVIPLDGSLGAQGAIFINLLSPDFDPVGVQAKRQYGPGHPVNPLPVITLTESMGNPLLWRVIFNLEAQNLEGKAFLMGTTSKLPPRQFWCELDHRDMS